MENVEWYLSLADDIMAGPISNARLNSQSANY